jgi:hypothetical protein
MFERYALEKDKVLDGCWVRLRGTKTSESDRHVSIPENYRTAAWRLPSLDLPEPGEGRRRPSPPAPREKKQ